MTPEPSPDNDLLAAYAGLMTQDNNYTYGPGNTTIYNTNGGSDDWMYGEQTTKDKIFAYTPECGGDGDGFWCPIDRIIPIAQENMIQNILLAAFAGNYANVEDLTPSITNATEGNFEFGITRLGLADGDFTVSLTPVDPVVISTGDPVVFSGLEVLETQTGTISYSLDPAIASGTTFKFLLTLDNGSYIISDTISKIFGQAIVLFEDDCNTMLNWTSTYWNITSEQYHSAPQSITDSPNGNYPNGANRVITFNSNIDLSNVAFAFLNFWARWEIEAGWDYVQVLISTNNGSSWTPLAGNYTKTGNENQAPGEPVYDGFQTTWVQEEIDLSDYIGNSVKFRFKLKADDNVTEDGFYFDDFSVSVVNEATTGFDDPSALNQINIMSDPIPNPACNSVKINLNLPESYKECTLRIYSVSGQQVYSATMQSKQTSLVIPVENWNPGLYYYRLEGEILQPVSKKLMVL